jgi:hypothetical protein
MKKAIRPRDKTTALDFGMDGSPQVGVIAVVPMEKLPTLTFKGTPKQSRATHFHCKPALAAVALAVTSLALGKPLPRLPAFRRCTLISVEPYTIFVVRLTTEHQEQAAIASLVTVVRERIHLVAQAVKGPHLAEALLGCHTIRVTRALSNGIMQRSLPSPVRPVGLRSSTRRHGGHRRKLFIGVSWVKLVVISGRVTQAMVNRYLDLRLLRIAAMPLTIERPAEQFLGQAGLQHRIKLTPSFWD